MSIPIQVVNEKDQPTGQADKDEIWSKGLWHRVARVMLVNDKDELLLQHRVPSKKIFPNCWDNSAAGHVDAGEDYAAAAARELREELGVDVELREIGYYKSSETWHGLKFNRFAKVYVGRYNGTPTDYEPSEVDAVRWFTLRETQALVSQQPDEVSDGLRQVIERFSTQLAITED